MDGILMVTSRPLYDHGSRAGVTRYFIYELRGVIRERHPPHDCYLDFVVGPMRLLDLKTSARPDQRPADKIRQKDTLKR